MPEDKAKGSIEKPANVTVGVSIDMLTAENGELKLQLAAVSAERDTLRTAVDEANAVLEADVREQTYTAIMSMSNYTRAELEQQYPVGDQNALRALQRLRESLTRGMGASAGKGTFKAVSAAKDSVIHGSVPDLFGKTRETVLKELGNL